MRRLSVLGVLTLLFATFTPACWGQDRGTILGRVTDPSSAVIAGATITVTNLDTGIPIGSTSQLVNTTYN